MAAKIIYLCHHRDLLNMPNLDQLMNETCVPGSKLDEVLSKILSITTDSPAPKVITHKLETPLRVFLWVQYFFTRDDFVTAFKIIKSQFVKLTSSGEGKSSDGNQEDKGQGLTEHDRFEATQKRLKVELSNEPKAVKDEFEAALNESKAVKDAFKAKVNEFKAKQEIWMKVQDEKLEHLESVIKLQELNSVSSKSEEDSINTTAGVTGNETYEEKSTILS